MSATLISRRQLAVRIAALPAALGAAARVVGAAPDGGSPQVPADADGLSHASEEIHQEVTFKAPRQRVYRALTDAKQFDALTRLSDAVELLRAPGAKSTAISAEAGGRFTLFGGYITGRNLELLQDEHLVQAWRAASWKPDDYSVVQFALQEQGAGTKLVFDHKGFPEGEGAHLARGWHTHYWEPITAWLTTQA